MTTAVTTDEEWRHTKIKFLKIRELVCIKADLETQGA